MPERYLGRARAELAEDAATAAWEEGRRTRFEHAIALALDARAGTVLSVTCDAKVPAQILGRSLFISPRAEPPMYPLTGILSF